MTPTISRRLARAGSPLLAVLVALSLVCLVGSCGSSTGSAAEKSAPTTAAELVKQMNEALRTADSLTGRGVVRLTTSLGTQAYAFSFAATSSGDYRLETELQRLPTSSTVTPYRRSLLVYNAGERRRVLHSWQPVVAQPSTGALEPLPSSSSASTRPAGLWSVETDVPSFAVLSEGVQDLQGLGPLDPEFASSARAALAAEGATAIAGSTSGGRPVWETAVQIPWPTPATGRVLTSVRLVVDQATGLTSSMTLLFADGWRARIDYSDLHPNADIPSSAFDTSVPASAAGGSSGSGSSSGGAFRFLSLKDVQARTGVPVFLPTFTYSGFSLSQVATAQTGRRGSFGTTTDVWLVYRDGLESYELRLQKAPFGMTPDWETFAGLKRRDLYHGPFDGQPANTWVRGAAQGTFEFVGPGLFVENGQEVARFSGDLLPYEFWQVANSLKPAGP